MPQLQMKLPQIPDVPWQDAQYTFNGQWLPDIDAALIGPENYAVLENLRYKDKGLEGVNGYTRVNSTTALSDRTNIRNGIQLQSGFTTPSYNLAWVEDGTNAARTYVNTTAVGSAGDFETAENFDPTGKPSSKVPYIFDDAVNRTGRFGDAPQGSVVYCTGQDSKIFSGYESAPAAIFACTDQEGGNVIDITEDLTNDKTTEAIYLCANLAVDGDMESDPTTNWATLQAGAAAPTITAETTTVHSGSNSIKIVTDGANGDEDGIQSAASITVTSNEYVLSYWVHSSGTTVKHQMLDGDDGAAHADGVVSTTVVANTWTKIVDKVTMTAGGNAKIQIMGAANSQTLYVDDVSFCRKDRYPELHIMTTRPIQGFRFYLTDNDNENTGGSALDIEYWGGAAFTDVTDDDDDTDDGTDTLVTSGYYRFAHTGGNADGTATGGDSSTLSSYVEFRHFQELYMYAYRIRLSAGASEIYRLSVDYGFNPLQNIWDGIYRQPIQWQFWDQSAGAFEDYTLHVNQSSDINTPVGGLLDGMTSSDEVYIMFEEQVSSIKFTMLGALVNKATQIATLYYWDGYEWTALTKASHGFVDGTLNDAEDTSFNRSGIMSWTPPGDEEKQTKFNSLGYCYKLVVDGTLTDTTAGKDAGNEDIVVDICNAIPALKNAAGRHEVEPFDFSCIYRNRVMLGSYSAGGELNRMDFSASNAPDVWNGFDTSDGGKYSLYFGNETKITNAVQLYNRFGSNIYTMLLVLKESETYLLTGNSASDFQKFPVSLNIGCPAPLTLATAEVGMAGQGGGATEPSGGSSVQRQVAIWCSHYGPMMFDGAVLQPIRGVDKYFDQGETEGVNWSAMADARGWVDHSLKEYNLLIPSTSGQTTNNVWLVYDLVRRKWFSKNTGTSETPQSAWPVVYTTGRQGVYGGLDTGYMIQIEEGTSWDCTYAAPTGGGSISQKVRTGDFFPSNNIWDNCLLRKFKLICEKIDATATINLGINYYENAANSASNVQFQDSDSQLGVNVDFTDMDVDSDGVKETIWASSAEAVLELTLDVGTDRLVRLIRDLNQLGWSHSFEFTVDTTTVDKGWKPIAWGVQYRVERKDNTAT